MWSLVAFLLLPVVWAQTTTIPFVPAQPCPTCSSRNYVGKNNGTLPKATVRKGKVFDYYIEIMMENQDPNIVDTLSAYEAIAKKGIMLTNTFSLTHPSEPNYLASWSGSFWGAADDDFHAVPENIMTMTDLLEDKTISWASYQENMPTDGFTGMNFTQANYVNVSGPPEIYYMRKHNPHILHDSIANNPQRRMRVRNFEDFAADITADRLPQYNWVTSNMRNDAHDTNAAYSSSWLNFWLLPLLEDKRFNRERTLIMVRFDEDATDGGPNKVAAFLLGSAVPEHMYGSVDNTFYTHYSSLSTMEANWGLDCLGRGDTNATLANVFDLVANQIGYKNVDVSDKEITSFGFNISGSTPGPFNPNPDLVTPFPPPNSHAKCPGGGKVIGIQNNGSGHGNGDGNGNGKGSGNESGKGSGNGNGKGSGNESGKGSGNGSGKNNGKGGKGNGH
ncbi:hypothetical protein PILCRDRAFT_814381 [Piloderma croceum F 1598]|uniref:Acid phosphatase n=1 Tax=Piloderma croceum (strain F 1598) TaxID=765440 RepID=A0A0C3G9S0_PILCF|nr:hypothetical protein PILCRDRAFT_814381 [Piloderma croceum F 1598]